MQISDTIGNFLQNASATKNRKIWCNFSDEILEGKPFEVPNYTINELSDQENKPHAIALVLDHSGSMGKERTILMQKAVQEFIKNKKEEDAILLIKYDEKYSAIPLITVKESSIIEIASHSRYQLFGGIKSWLPPDSGL